MERLKKEVVGGWEIKAWRYRSASTEPDISHWIPAKRRQSGTVPMICSYKQGAGHAALA